MSPALFAAPSLLTPEFVVTIGLLVGVLLAGALVLYYTDIWRKRQVAAVQDSAQTLSDYRAMFERGELTAAEYAAVRDKVATKIKAEVGVRSAAERPVDLADEPELPADPGPPAAPLDPPGRT